MKETEENIEEWKEVEKESKGYVAWEDDMIDKPVIGRFESFEKGAQGGQIATLTDEKGEQFKCSASTILYDLLKGREGQTVKIVYMGQKKSNTGRIYKDFKLSVKCGGTLATARAGEQQGEGAQAPSPIKPCEPSQYDRVEAFV